MSRLSNHIAGFGDNLGPLTDDTERAQTLYFNWLCNLVRVDDYCCKKWYILAKTLHDIDFYWTIPNDDNRATDGVKLRSVWLSSIKNESEDLGVALYVPEDSLNGPCTMFEMMVALANRIESDIMQEDIAGNRVWIWFWGMVMHLLSDAIPNNCNWWYDACNDDAITPTEYNIIKEMVRKCLDREYEGNGRGGCLFPIMRNDTDRRSVEIWYQAQDWLNESYIK